MAGPSCLASYIRPEMEKPAVVNFPVIPENPYQVDLDACRALIDEHRPELIIMGRSMNHFKDDYQRQVIVNVGYAQGPEIARLLEDNIIILNYQASPVEEGFTASGSLRMGVAEMTRFGMVESDFQRLAELMNDVILQKKDVKQTVTDFRKQFLTMQYCFNVEDFQDLFEKIHDTATRNHLPWPDGQGP